MNSWVIPDIHGCFKTFKALVEEQIHLTREDELFLLGDYIDRGTSSKQVLDYIINLQKEGYCVKPIMGNHEWFLLQAYQYVQNQPKKRWCPRGHDAEKDWMIFGGAETLKSFAVKSVAEIPDSYITWISTLPYYRFAGSFILVHAGLNFKQNDPFTDTHFMLFNSDFQIDHQKLGARTIIHGHYPIQRTFFEEQRKNYKTDGFLDLDLGCVYSSEPQMGYLIGLNLQTMDVKIQENIEY